MITIKKIIILLIYILIAVYFIYSNEKQENNQQIYQNKIYKNFNFKFGINNNLMNKNNNNSYMKKVKTFLYMGIIGSSITGVGAITTGTGVIFMTVYSWAGNVSYYLQYTGAIMFIVGSGLFIIGLPFMIVGFVLSAIFRKRMNAFINTDNKEMAMGITIKI